MCSELKFLSTTPTIAMDTHSMSPKSMTNSGQQNYVENYYKLKMFHTQSIRFHFFFQFDCCKYEDSWRSKNKIKKKTRQFQLENILNIKNIEKTKNI